MTTENIFDRIQRIDRRVVFLVTALVITLPLLFPIGIPFVPSPYALSFHDAIEALPDGSVVLSMNAFGPEDLEKMWAKRAMTNRLFEKNCKIIEVSFDAPGPIAMSKCYEELLDQQLLATKTYGEDYIFLPYVAGIVVAYSAVARDIRSATGGVDYYGDSLDSYPIMEDVNAATDVDFLALTGHHTSTAIEPVVGQVQTYANKPLVVISAGISHALTSSFIASGNIKAALEGLTDMAGYELLIKDPGLNIAQMDVVSAHHLMLVLLIIVGNIVFLLSKNKKSEVKK